MKIRLGYVAISMAFENVTSSSIMTYSHYKKLGVVKGMEKLNTIIESNFNDLREILKYNLRNEVSFYRMTSRLIPLATHESVDINLEDYKNQFEAIGKIIKENNMRVDTHPDQFCVINSVKSDVVASSISILKHHQNMFDLMKYDGKMILHIGSSADGKIKSMKRFEETFISLEDNLKKMLLLENDDKVFNIVNTLKLCEKLNIPMVLDYHHHLCNNTGQKIENYIERIFDTWGQGTPKIHFSSPKNKKQKRSHHDFIDMDNFIKLIERIKFIDRDFDIMLEAKMKDDALFKLVRQLKYKTDYKFINNTTFIVK